MKKPSRRQVLSGLAITVLAAPFRNFFVGNVAAAQDPAADATAEALRAVRFINTAQALSVHTTGAFGTLTDLNSPQMRSIYEQRYERSRLEGIRLLGDEIVPGFTAALEVTSDRHAYRLVVVERAAKNGVHFAYASDETGVIRVGTVPTAFIATPLTHFNGTPIQKPAVRQSSTGNLARSIIAFFVPTLYANESRCGASNCGTCFTGTAYQCGSGCANCCNLGYSGCEWCCMTWAGCAC
jgi:hypothetical protein